MSNTKNYIGTSTPFYKDWQGYFDRIVKTHFGLGLVKWKVLTMKKLHVCLNVCVSVIIYFARKTCCYYHNMSNSFNHELWQISESYYHSRTHWKEIMKSLICCWCAIHVTQPLWPPHHPRGMHIASPKQSLRNFRVLLSCSCNIQQHTNSE